MEYNLRGKKGGAKKHCYFILIVLWILMGFSYGTADYGSYESYFERTASGAEVLSVEPGYIFLNYLADKVGLNYKGFLAIYSLIAFLLIGSTLKRYAKCPNFVLFAYFCYPFILDVTQIRHFMVSAIVIYAIRFLEYFSLKNLFKYLVCILIASTQQITAIIYFLLLLAYIPSLSLLKNICLVGSASLLFLVRLIPNTQVFHVIMGLRNAEKIYEFGMSGSQLLLYIVFYLTLLLLCIVMSKRTTNYFNGSEILHKVCYLSFLLIPFLLLDFQYTRFFRGIIILIYIYLTNILSSFKSVQDRKVSLLLMLFMFFAVGFKIFGPHSGYYSYLTSPIFSNNYIFGFLF